MKRVLLVGIVCLLLLGITGCGTMERLLKNNGTDPLGQLLNNNVPAASSNLITGESKSVIVYFADTAGKLISQERQIPKTLSPARETLAELLNGPGEGNNLQGVIPQGTTLLDINIKDETAIVDLSQEFLKTTKPELAVYSVVNTLTQFSTIKSVKFRVEGKTVSKLGSFNLSQTLTRNTTGVSDGGTKHPITQQPSKTTNSLTSPTLN
jgi:germination protein M